MNRYSIAPGGHTPSTDQVSGHAGATRRRVLVLSYYFPPMGMSGVQRVSKFVKYLPSFGWEPTVLTCEPAGYFAFDPDLMEEIEQSGIRVERTRSFDPTRLFGRKTVALPEEGRRRRLAWLSQALFIPDNKIGWAPPAVRRATRLLKEARFDAVLSSAPPYTAHVAGARIARRFGIPLVTDYRDDWLENPRHEYPTALHRAAHARLERRVMRSARLVTTINDEIAGAIGHRHPSLSGSNRIRILPQGFDPDDYPERSDRGERTTLRLVYTGVFYDAQTPTTFLEGLARFISARPDADIAASFLGLFPDSERTRIHALGLDRVVDVGPYVTHRKAMQAVMESDVPWLVVGRRDGAEQISTGKLYAYAGSRKPVLALVPDGAAKRALEAYGATYFADPDDPESVCATLCRLHDDWKAGSFPIPNEDFVTAHDRRRIAGQLAELLEEACDPA